MALRKYREGGRIPIPADAPPAVQHELHRLQATEDHLRQEIAREQAARGERAVDHALAKAQLHAAPPSSASPPPDDNELAKRLAELQQAEVLARQQQAEGDARVEAALRQAHGDDPVAAMIDAMTHLSEKQRDWLKRHRDAFTDPAKNAYLSAAHWDAIRAGHDQDSDGYFAALEEKLGYRQPTPAPAPQRRSLPVSAPVSRDAPNLTTGHAISSRVELSLAEREAAKFSGMSEQEYAANKLRLLRAKAAGMYQEKG